MISDLVDKNIVNGIIKKTVDSQRVNRGWAQIRTGTPKNRNRRGDW